MNIYELSLDYVELTELMAEIAISLTAAGGGDFECPHLTGEQDAIVNAMDATERLKLIKAIAEYTLDIYGDE